MIEKEKITAALPLIRQETEYNCGPACSQMVLAGRGIIKAQEEIAAAEGASERGTDPARLASCLNEWLSRDGAAGYRVYRAKTDDFLAIAGRSLRAGRPVICIVNPSFLPNYAGSGITISHYIVICEWRNQPDGFMIYNDPHFADERFGTFSAPAAVLEQAVRAAGASFIAAETK